MRRRTSDSACQLWTGEIDDQGYGRTIGNRLVYRLRFNEAYGELPGVTLHHVCGTKACVNPDHLEPLGATLHVLAHRPGFTLEQLREFERLANTDILPAELAERFDITLASAVTAREDCRRLRRAVAL
jgi:hypothetical protein